MPDQVLLEGLEIRAGERTLVHDARLRLAPGELLALVGASGSGKTLTTRSLLGMVDIEPGIVRAELTITLDGETLRPYAELPRRGRRRGKALEARFRALRGPVFGYMPQDARGSLDPLLRVGRQVRECLALAGRSLDPLPWLSRAGFSDPERVAGLYPHELSGGMAQRASIALALARGGRFLLADEPTTGLDPTVQEAILRELVALKRAGVGVLLITHDLRIVARIADRVAVMHQGRLVEDLRADQMDQMASPEGQALLAATARVAAGAL